VARHAAAAISRWPFSLRWPLPHCQPQPFSPLGCAGQMAGCHSGEKAEMASSGHY